MNKKVIIIIVGLVALLMLTSVFISFDGEETTDDQAAAVRMTAISDSGASDISSLREYLVKLISELQDKLAQLERLAGRNREISPSDGEDSKTRAGCPQINTPACPNGTLVSKGTDSNGCSKGYSCKEKTPAVSCPQLNQPECPNGTLVSNGTDDRGCSKGYTCKVTSSSGASLSLISKDYLTVKVLAKSSSPVVNWGDGTNTNCMDSTSCQMSHTYSRAGTYKIVLQGGKSTDSGSTATLTVTVASKPVGAGSPAGSDSIAR